MAKTGIPFRTGINPAGNAGLNTLLLSSHGITGLSILLRLGWILAPARRGQ